jgi:hypothetical protein
MRLSIPIFQAVSECKLCELSESKTLLLNAVAFARLNSKRHWVSTTKNLNTPTGPSRTIQTLIENVNPEFTVKLLNQVSCYTLMQTIVHNSRAP